MRDPSRPAAPPLSGRGRSRCRLAAPLFFAGALAGCGGSEEPAEPPPEEAPAPVAPAPVEPPPPPPKPEPAAPTTGGLSVVGTAGAAVFVDGERLGTVPGEFADLRVGERRVRVEHENHHPLEVTMTIRGGGVRTLDATLVERLGSIAVESSPAGAMVFLDRNFKGNTPVTIEELQPDRYRLMVSAEGFEVHHQEVEVDRERVPVQVAFEAAEATLDIRVEVVHKHRFGSCAGTLVATPTGFEYRTDHKDAFELAFDRVERFELDYLEDNLRLKVRRGRTYNFETPDGNVDPLFVFHRDVEAFRAAPR